MKQPTTQENNPERPPALAEARGYADSERLDYLEQHQRADISFYMSTAGPRWKIGNKYDYSKGWQPSLRDAIDASRHNTQVQPRRKETNEQP